MMFQNADHKELLSLIYDPEKIEEWIRLGIKQVKYHDLKNAIENDEDPDTILFEHFRKYLKSALLKPIIITVFRVNWKQVETILCDVPGLHQTLTDNRPEFKILLSTPKAKHWLNRCAKKGYNTIYRYVWG